MADENQMTMNGVEEIVGEEEKPRKKGGKLKLIMIIALVVIVGGGAGTYFMFGNQIKSRFFGVSGEQGQEKKKESIGPILSLEPFIFNIGGNSGKFAKITLGVELKDAKVMEEAKKMIPAMRDRLLSALGAKTADILVDIASRENLKKELHSSIKALFKEDSELRSVYITDIIIQ